MEEIDLDGILNFKERRRDRKPNAWIKHHKHTGVGAKCTGTVALVALVVRIAGLAMPGEIFSVVVLAFVREDLQVADAELAQVAVVLFL